VLNAWGWLALSIAIDCVAGVTLRSYAKGSAWGALAATVVLYTASYVVGAWALRDLTAGAAFAVWAAVPLAVLFLVGVVAWGEPATVGRVAALLLVLLGVAGLAYTEPR